MTEGELRGVFERAVKLHQSGRMAEAAALYQDILNAAPAHVGALRFLGICHFQQGQYEAGISLIERVLTIRPNDAEAHNDIATALRALNRHDEAVARYRQALAIKPQFTEAHFNLAIALQALGRHAEAVAHYGEALAIQPRQAQACNNLGVALNALGRSDQAVAAYRRALEIQPGHLEARCNLANSLVRLGQNAEAVSHYEQAVASKPNDAEIHNGLGMALDALGRRDEAAHHYARALALAPNYADAHNNLAALLHASGRHDEALAHYHKALAIHPRAAGIHNNLANTYRALGRHDDAIGHYKTALDIDPNLVEAHNNLGNAFAESQRAEDAIVHYERALAIDPNHPETHNNLGHSLHEFHRPEQAITHYRAALAGKPDYAEAHNNLGLALAELNQFSGAVAHYRAALVLDPDSAETHGNLAHALKALNRHEEAIVHYEKAYALQPGMDFLFGTLVHTRMTVADWADAAGNFARIASGIEAGEKICHSFATLAMPLSSRQQRHCAEIYARDIQPRGPALPPFAGRAAAKRIRIGYFSSDLHGHATAYLAAGLFEHHDRDRFDVTAFSYGPLKHDAMRARLEKGFDRFVDVSAMSDRDVAQLARSLEIDIAVDLKGFTKDGRSGIFALRAAPVQVSYLGYPGTLGMDAMDYLVADAVVLPHDHRAFYREKIAYLPHSYQVNDNLRAIAERHLSRREAGLPDEGFVFCCFNKHYKITPDLFDVWMRLLGKVDRSVLWLFEDSALGTRNLRSAAVSRGIDGKRLIFAPAIDMPDHLARHRLADLFIDTLYYNAHTTASDALWAGLPVLTCKGGTFAARVAASLLEAVGLPQLVTTSLEAYEAAAIELAGNPQQLLALKETLVANRLTQPLFDTQRFTRNLETAYRMMWDRFQNGQPPDHILVPADTG